MLFATPCKKGVVKVVKVVNDQETLLLPQEGSLRSPTVVKVVKVVKVGISRKPCLNLVICKRDVVKVEKVVKAQQTLTSP